MLYREVFCTISLRSSSVHYSHYQVFFKENCGCESDVVPYLIFSDVGVVLTFTLFSMNVLGPAHNVLANEHSFTTNIFFHKEFVHTSWFIFFHFLLK